jgi:hypothetical protein
MSTTKHADHIGKEDIKIQTNTSTAETYQRLTSTGEKITMTKVPDIWDGTGQLIIGKLIVKALDDNDTVLHSFGGTS